MPTCPSAHSPSARRMVVTSVLNTPRWHGPHQAAASCSWRPPRIPHANRPAPGDVGRTDGNRQPRTDDDQPNRQHDGMHGWSCGGLGRVLTSFPHCRRAPAHPRAGRFRRSERCAIGGEGNGDGVVDVAGEDGLLGPCGGIPEPDRAVVAGRAKDLAVGGELDAMEVSTVSREGGDLARVETSQSLTSRSCLPDARTVPSGRRPVREPPPRVPGVSPRPCARGCRACRPGPGDSPRPGSCRPVRRPAR